MDAQRQNAYRVLKLPETATQQEIRSAYKKLEQKYSKARYMGSPLSDMAEEKRELVRAAYELLTSKAASEKQAPASMVEDAGITQSVNRQLRTLLNQNRLDEAQTILDRQINADRDPEMLYLKGMLAWKRGWLDEATRCLDQAVSMRPKNREYRSAREKVASGPAPSARLRRLKRDDCKEVCAACTFECLCEVICDSICSGS